MAFEWDIDRSCFPALPTLGTSPTADQQAAYDVALAVRNAAEDLAVATLWSLSGRQFGLYDMTIRPCRQERSFGGLPGWGRGIYGPDSGYYGEGILTSYVLSWEGDMGWVNLPCGCVGGQCRVSGPRMIHLPGPAQSISSVIVNGVTLDPAEYSLEKDALYRVGAIWPFQDLNRPAGELGTWSVTYQRGIPVPNGVAQLTGQLAAEFISACSNSNKCRLPRNVVAVNRNGISYQVYDPTTFYAAGKTGLPEIDLWLMAVNPSHIMRAPSVL